MSATSALKVIDDNRYAILIVVAAAAAYFIYQGFKSAVNTVQTAGGHVIDSLADINANTDYQDTGVVGTLGHLTDIASGGTLSRLGEWIGGALADTFQQPGSPIAGSIPSSNQDSEASGSIQTGRATPYSNGPNAAYQDAWNSSPIDPSYAGNALVTDPNIGLTGQ